MIFRSLALRSGLIGLGGMVVLSIVPASAVSLVTNGDFSLGDSGFLSDYASTLPITAETQYTVVPASNINSPSTQGYGDWSSVSTDPSGGNGNVLLANGATSPNFKVWYQTVGGVQPNTFYTFSFYGVDVNASRNSDAVIQLAIQGIGTGTLSTNGSWQLGSFSWYSGPNSGAIALALIDTNTDGAFNDFAIDQISFAAPESTPLPAALPLFASGLGVLGLLGWRRKRKGAAALAA
jgi:hypothetical protein